MLGALRKEIQSHSANKKISSRESSWPAPSKLRVSGKSCKKSTKSNFEGERLRGAPLSVEGMLLKIFRQGLDFLGRLSS